MNYTGGIRQARHGKDGSDVSTAISSFTAKPANGFPLSFKITEHQSKMCRLEAASPRKLLELLHMHQPKMRRPEVSRKSINGDHVGKRSSSTTPDIRVPAYVFIPKKGKLPAPAWSPCTITAAFYLWARKN